jgi:hypothetical protein
MKDLTDEEIIKQVKHMNETIHTADHMPINGDQLLFNALAAGKISFVRFSVIWKKIHAVTTTGSVSDEEREKAHNDFWGKHEDPYDPEKKKGPGIIQQMLKTSEKRNEGVEQGGWISVKDRLPNTYLSSKNWDGLKSDDVLCYNDGGVCRGVLYETKMDGSHYFDWYDEDDWDLVGVTHWMPLPEPPKK